MGQKIWRSVDLNGVCQRMDVFSYGSCCAHSDHWILNDKSVHVFFFWFLCFHVYGMHHWPIHLGALWPGPQIYTVGGKVRGKIKLWALWPGPQSHTVQTYMGVLSDRARESQLDRLIACTIGETFPWATNEAFCKEAQEGRYYYIILQAHFTKGKLRP